MTITKTLEDAYELIASPENWGRFSYHNIDPSTGKENFCLVGVLRWAQPRTFDILDECISTVKQALKEVYPEKDFRLKEYLYYSWKKAGNITDFNDDPAIQKQPMMMS